MYLIDAEKLTFKIPYPLKQDKYFSGFRDGTYAAQEQVENAMTKSMYAFACPQHYGAIRSSVEFSYCPFCGASLYDDDFHLIVEDEENNV